MRAVAVAAALAIVAATLFLGVSSLRGTSSEIATMAPAFTAPEFVPADQFAGDCPAPSVRPSRDDYAANRAQILDVLRQAGEETARTGFHRTMEMRLDGPGWVCGWAPDDLWQNIAQDERFYDSSLHASFLLSEPSADATPLGLIFGPGAFVTMDQMSDPSFDREALMQARFGCSLNLLNEECRIAADDWVAEQIHASQGSSD
jgi:hypothetical protein